MLTMEKRVIEKHVQASLPKQNIVLPYSGNLTEKVWRDMAARLRRYLHSGEYHYEGGVVNDEITYQFLRGRGFKYKNTTITRNENGRYDIRGEGWSCGNHPAQDWTILE